MTGAYFPQSSSFFLEDLRRPGTFAARPLDPEQRKWVLANAERLSCEELGAQVGRSSSFIGKFLQRELGRKKRRRRTNAQLAATKQQTPVAAPTGARCICGGDHPPNYTEVLFQVVPVCPLASEAA